MTQSHGKMSEIKKLQKYGGFFVCFLVSILLGKVSTTAEVDDSKVVRVGWYEDSYRIFE